MKCLIVFISLIFVATFFISCKKEPVNSFDCSNLRTGIKSGKIDLVKNEINKICAGLSEPTVKEKLQKLAEIISSKCNMSASVLCTECIETLPPQSEIKISFTIAGTQYSKAIDTISRDPLEFAGMHE